MLMISSQYHRILQTNLQPLSNIHLGFPPSFALLATTKFNSHVTIICHDPMSLMVFGATRLPGHGAWRANWRMQNCCAVLPEPLDQTSKIFKEKVDGERLAISFSYRSKCLQLLDIDYLQFYLWAVLSMSHRTSVALELWQLYAGAAFTPCL